MESNGASEGGGASQWGVAHILVSKLLLDIRVGLVHREHSSGPLHLRGEARQGQSATKAGHLQEQAEVLT